MVLGAVRKKHALSHVCVLQPLAVGADEQLSPLGRNNFPNYELSKGIAPDAPVLAADCAMYDVIVRSSRLPDTEDGPSGREVVVKKNVKKGQVIMYYWGEFLFKNCSRYRKLVHARCNRFMTMTNLDMMSEFVLLGHPECAGVYVQSAQYTGPGQADIVANVEFREQRVNQMSPLYPWKYVQVVALKDIAAGSTLYSDYTTTAKHGKKKVSSKRKKKTPAKR